MPSPTDPQTAVENAYDLIPYKSHPFPQSHPDRLATMATLFGMSPAPPDGSRILELGCASGGNIVPMAEQLPGSTLLGIDFSARQIAMGQDMVKGRRTEIEQLNGFIVGKAKEIGLPVPANAALTDIVKRVEKGELRPDKRHILDLRLN